MASEAPARGSHGIQGVLYFELRRWFNLHKILAAIPGPHRECAVIKRSFACSAVSIGSRLLVGLLLFILLSRLWGPSQFGLFSFVFSVAALLTLLLDFGLATFLMREIGAHPQRAACIVAEALYFKLLLLFPTGVSAVAAVLLLGPEILPVDVALPMLLAAWAVSFSDFFAAPLRALGRYGLEARTVAMANAAQFLLAGSVAWMGGSPSEVAWAMAGGRGLLLVLAWRTMGRVLPGLALARLRPGGMPGVLGRVWSYGVDGFLSMAWTQLDVVLVRWLFGVQGVGLYSAGQKLVLGVAQLGPVVGNVLIPQLARQSAQRLPEFWATAARTALLMLGVGAVFAVPLLLAPEQVAHWVFGQQFAGLGALLPWFGGWLLIRSLATSAAIVVTAAGQQSARVLLQLLGLSVAGVAVAAVAWWRLPLSYLIGSVLLGLIAMTAGHAGLLMRYRAGYVNAKP